MSGSRTKLRLQTVALLLFSLVLCVGVTEAVLRFRLVDAYYVWPPNLRLIMKPDPTIIHGIEGPSEFTINSFGVRAGPFTDEQRYRILAIGGSTTICSYIDDAKTWAHLIQDDLDDHLGAGTTWVGNVGRPGHKTHQHLRQVEELLRQHQEIDAILLLVGINDMVSDLAQRSQMEAGEAQERPPSPDPLANDSLAFSVFPGWDEKSPWYQRTAIGRWWTVHLKPRLDARGENVQDDHGALVGRMRLRRKEASSFRRELPNLTAALAAYSQRVNEIIDKAEAEEVRVILLTQPSIWRKGLTRAEDDLLWGGRTGLKPSADGAHYYAVEALAEAMEMYNVSLLRVCRTRGVECVALHSKLPRDATTFTDDAHFTELGARRVADAVVEHLLKTEPLTSFERGEPGPDLHHRDEPADTP